MHIFKTTLEYNSITDGIFIGNNYCCQVHIDKMLKDEGITAVISLEEDKTDSPFGVTFYTWIPTVNYTPPTQDQLNFGVSVLEKLVSMKQKIYVHCKNGHGRAPTLVISYLVKNGMSPTEAENFVKEKRPTMHLEDSQRNAINNFQKNL